MNIYRLIRAMLPVALKPPEESYLKRLLVITGYYRFRTRLASRGEHVPDVDLYRPLFSPWEGSKDFRPYYNAIEKHTLVDTKRCWMLFQFMKQALALEGDFAEFGVYRGGTALLAAQVLRDADDDRLMHLFDSFAGMPKTSAGEAFESGDFKETSEAMVSALLEPVRSNNRIHAGFFPQSFEGLRIEKIAFAYVDVDLYQSMLDCIDFVYPRLVNGGIIIFDDYGYPSCARAREAVDKAFAILKEKPIYLPTGQALIIKLPASGKKDE
jgi:O-methyltransferase